MRKGFKMTLEQRKRVSEGHKGQVSWNKNVKVDRTKFPNMGHFTKNSEEIKIKISEATKKAMSNPKIRRKISESKKGKPSPMKGKKTGKTSWMKGKQHTEETKMKMREAVNKRWLNPEYREKMSLAQKERFAHGPSPRKGTHASQETLRKLSESHKRIYAWRHFKKCSLCGKEFERNIGKEGRFGREKYCSEECKKEGHKLKFN